MNVSRGVAYLSIVLALGFCLPVSADSDVTVSVTITGPIDKLVPLLQQMREAVDGEQADSGAMKIEMHSAEGAPEGVVSEKSVEPAPGASVPVPTGPALLEARIQPSAGSVGQAVLITVKAVDPAHQIDTVAATIEGMAAAQDLYDNGTRGDIQAKDGVWSTTVTLSPQLEPGEHRVWMYAFNRNGGAVTTTDPDGNPVSLNAQTSLTIVP